MNWMTSGRHRALRATRGRRRRETHFPAHVQRETARVRRHALAVAPSGDGSGARGDEAKTAWYIRPILDANESHDIQMLALAREAVTGTSDAGGGTAAAPRTPPATKPATEMSGDVGGGEEKEKPAGRRCVFTPVKANRSRGRGDAQRPLKRLKSPPPRNLLLFNEGEQVSKALPGASLPGTCISSTNSEAQLQYAGLAAHSVRWSSDPSENSGLHNEGNWGQGDEAPFYAASSPSSDEGTLGEHMAGERATPRMGVCATSSPSQRLSMYEVDSVEAPPRASLWGLRPNLLEEIDHALHNIASSVKQTQKASAGQQSVFTANDKQFVTSSQGRSEPDPVIFQEAQARRLSPLANGDRECHQTFPVAEEPVGAVSLLEARLSSHHEIDGGCLDAETHRSLLGKRSTREEEIAESDSSQGSFVLPPPVDWQKMIVTRYSETAQGEGGKNGIQKKVRGTIGEDHASSQPGSLVSKPNDPTTSIKGDQSLEIVWRSTLRTQSILSKVQGGLSCRTQEKTADEKILQLHRELLEKDALVIYMHTMLQCHRIDQDCEPRAPMNTQVQGTSTA